MGAETVDKHTGNYSLTKHTSSHHQPKPLKVKIYPRPLPTSFAISHNQLLVSHPRRRLLIGLISLIELHLRNMWESGLVAYQDYTQPDYSLCPITTINICNNKCLRNCSWTSGALVEKEKKSTPSAFRREAVLSEQHPAVETRLSLSPSLSSSRRCD